MQPRPLPRAVSQRRSVPPRARTSGQCNGIVQVGARKSSGPCSRAWPPTTGWPSPPLLAERNAVRVDAAPAEGVHALPAPGQVEDLEVTHPLGQRRINDEIVAVRLEAEARPQQEQRRSG